MDEVTTDMKTAFEAKLQELIEKKHKNTQILSRAGYIQMIAKIERAKQMKSGKKPGDYARLKKYDVETKGGVKRLIVPRAANRSNEDSLCYFIHTEEIFEILHLAHLATNHAGRDRLIQGIKKYKNITREMVLLYLSLCRTCEEKRRCFKSDLCKRNCTDESKEGDILRTSYISFIDKPVDEEYNFILVHEDCDTKFVQLRACKSKSVKETANILLDIYSIFGPSNVLRSDMGKEFCEEVVTEICKTWPEFSQRKFTCIDGTQTSSVNLGNKNMDTTLETIKEILNSRLQPLHRNKWVKELKMVQLIKNELYSNEVQCAPFNAMFKNNVIDGNIKNVGNKRRHDEESEVTSKNEILDDMDVETEIPQYESDESGERMMTGAKIIKTENCETQATSCELSNIKSEIEWPEEDNRLSNSSNSDLNISIKSENIVITENPITAIKTEGEMEKPEENV